MNELNINFTRILKLLVLVLSTYSIFGRIRGLIGGRIRGSTAILKCLPLVYCEL